MANDLKRIAFPAISCGAYGYPIDEAAQIALESTISFLEQDAAIENVVFVTATDEIYEAYRQRM